MMFRFLTSAVCMVLLAGPSLGQSVDFARDVSPIVQSRCFSCHGPDKQRGGLRLDRKAEALEGGDSGKVILAKDSAKSLLWQRVTSKDKSKRMPPTGEPLTDKQLATLKAWIDGGAHWPGGDVAKSDGKREHWAFQPLVRPSVPVVKAKDWIRNPIDAFVVHRLEKESLAHNKAADRRTLLRRLKFDLLGLPPTPEEVDAFVKDADPHAYEKWVDRFLASPHFGERWARHWLDVVRFAESDGFEMNRHRPNAWHYRDYVIRAFNEDRPYDRFVLEQLAGDAVGEDAATGFLVGGAADLVKSPDVVLTLQQRADELHDMVSTTSATLLGLTVGCARCHNHKFDPVSHVDYHAMKALFTGVQHGERPIKTGGGDSGRELAQIKTRLTEIAKHLEPLVARAPMPKLRPPVSRDRNVERFVPVKAKAIRMSIQATNGAEPCIDELEVFTAGTTPVNVALASRGTRATASGTFPGHAIHKLEHINDGQYGNSRSWISNEKGKGWVVLKFPEPMMIDQIVWSRDRGPSGHYNDRLPTRYVFEVSFESEKWQTVASSDDRAALDMSAPKVWATPEDREQAEMLLKEKATLEERAKQVGAGPVAYAGRFTTPEMTYRLHRGDPMEKREAVAPGGLASLGPKLTLPMNAPEPERRLALAKWIVDPANPLPARVIANRLWHHHFGTGIVATPSDFGLMGAKPSHPELLDWLASELIDKKWSLKHLHRLIVTSATYRQAGVSHPDGIARDAQVRLLWRFPSRRLEAEALRDSILAVSGKLNLKAGGPGFDLFEPNTNYVKVYTPRKDFGPEEWRRMIYQSKPRMQLDDTFGAFDCPDAGQIAPRRGRSITALQALNFLNSPFLMQQSKFFAERLEKEAGKSVDEQVRLGFRLAFSREATKEETSAAVELVREHGLLTFCRALYNANEFVFVD